ncbi:protein IQ-DOMAIN 3-like [Silene latifolia]|uniref:protein IQ-DOMAIN 3-like n=1 Tax=Silene latifolia TaxID=37657 RepID=UPI003D76F40D
MGRKGNWFCAMMKALNSEPKEDNNQKPAKSKKNWFTKKKRTLANTTPAEPVLPSVVLHPEPPNSGIVDEEHGRLGHPTLITQSEDPVLPSVVLHPEPPKLSIVDEEHGRLGHQALVTQPERLSGVNEEHEKPSHTNLATQPEKEVDEEHTQHANVVAPTTLDPLIGAYKEEMAATRIQRAYKGCMARRTLCAIRSLKRLSSVMQGRSVKRQTANTLKCMQTLARMQSQIRQRRLRIAEDNIVHQSQHKNGKDQTKEPEELKQSGDGWDSSGKTKEEIEAKLRSKHEAAVRRERSLAYASSRQQTRKSSVRSTTTLPMEPSNPNSGWSWLKQGQAARSWGNATTEPVTDRSSRIKAVISGYEILNAYAKRHNPEKSSPRKPNSPGTARKSNSAISPKAGLQVLKPGQSTSPGVAGSGSPTKDKERVTSSLNGPSYVGTMKSAKARSRLGGEAKRDESATPDRLSVSSSKKRVSPATSRRSSTSGYCV